MNYKVPGERPSEFGERVKAILRTTWASWQSKRDGERDSAAIAMHEQRECAFAPALLISQSRVEHAE